jgi:hypothetical protein
MSENKNQEKKIIDELRHAIHTNNYRVVHSMIEEIRTTGKVSYLPYLLDLLTTGCPESIKQDVLLLVGDLKLQECADTITGYIKNNKAGTHLAQLIASCWQSSLDFSNFLEIFTDCFITENYQTALESFTVIEEMLWRTKPELIASCRHILIDRVSEISAEKLPLYNELVKLLDTGRTAVQEDYPDLYLN